MPHAGIQFVASSLSQVSERPQVSRRRAMQRAIAIALALVLVPSALFALLHRPFPSDTTPEGAYMRVARSVGQDDPRGFFAYLETEAQWACFTIHDQRAKA